jgi:hypothetical protein
MEKRHHENFDQRKPGMAVQWAHIICGFITCDFDQAQ